MHLNRYQRSAAAERSDGLAERSDGLTVRACVALLLLLLCCGCHQAPQAAKEQTSKPQETLQAAVTTVALQSWPTIIRCQGSLVADDQTVLGSRVAGLVRRTLVDIGDRVSPGQTVVELDNAEFKLQLEAAEAALLQARAAVGLKPGDPVSKLDPLNAPPVREARATLEDARGRRERWQQLRNQNAVTEEELQALLAAEKVADARYASAVNGVNSNIAQIAVRSAEVDQAKQRITDSQITAPFASAVQQRMVAAGTFVQIGTPLLVLVRLDAVRFRGTVPERAATNLKVGQKLRLIIESLDQPIDASVTRINPALDLASRSLTFEALLDNQDGRLRPGLFAQAEITIDPEARALVIHESSLLEFAGAQKTWKVVDGMAKEQTVRPGRRVNQLVEIMEGLAPGDQIIADASLGRVAKIIPPAASAQAPTLTAAKGTQPKPPGEPVTGEPVTGEPVTGDAVKGDAVKGDAVKGDAVKGDAVDGDTVKGDRTAVGTVESDSDQPELETAPAG